MLEWVIIAVIAILMFLCYWATYKVIERSIEKVKKEEETGKRQFIGVPPNTPWYNHPNTWLIIWLIIFILMLIILW
jgi:Na+/melibiose symporter-like transporter